MNYKRKDTRFANRIARLADRKRATHMCMLTTKRFEEMAEQDINLGLCFEWATIVFDLLEGSKIAGHNVHGVGHTWIEYKGMLYDAEVPQGVRSWLSLPFWVRLRNLVGAKEFNAAVRRIR